MAELDITSATYKTPTTVIFNDRGVHRETGSTSKYAGTPVALDFGIKIRYDPSDENEPWRYEITPPTGDGFRVFLGNIYVSVIGGVITGGNFSTPEQAEEEAVAYAKRITKRYKQYREGQTKAKDYTLTVPLDTDDNKE